MIGSASIRWKNDDCCRRAMSAAPQALCCNSIRYSVSSITDMSFGSDLADDPAAVEHDQPVGDLVDVREIVLDVDAGAAGSP